ncbi:MAG: hypothetical protein L3K10_02890 [Thermoplasmata archaeon]|nr:hypothetical protein [Thermoplasmata archaeon]
MAEPANPDPYFLSDAYFADVGRIADSGLEHRNQMIEWAHGIVAAVLVGVLVTQGYNSEVAWLAAGFVSVFLTPLFSLAVTEHSYFMRYNLVRRALLEYRLGQGGPTGVGDLARLRGTVEAVELRKAALLSRGEVIREVLFMGYGYLLVASYAAFVLLSQRVVTTTNVGAGLLSGNPQAWLIVLVLVGFTAAIAREYYFLATTRTLRQFGGTGRAPQPSSPTPKHS